jgi:CrcB protein
MLIIMIAAGSAIGGVFRYLLTAYVQQHTGTEFPLGTLTVNIVGSLLLGIFLRYALGSQEISAETRALLTTGFCGGFTTFSTFSYESVRLLQDGDYRRAATYVLASVAVSLAAMFLGLAIGAQLLTWRRGV